MNDEVSVTEILEREGWQEDPSGPRSRFRVIAVLLAVVLGCGLAAILVHIGSQDSRTDSNGPAVFNLPHGPTGGLAGGGVPASPDDTQVTGTSSSITVTNEAGSTGSTDSDWIPWTTKRHKATTVTVTESSTPPSSGKAGATTTPAGTPGSATPGPNSSSAPSAPPSCVVLFLFCHSN